MFRAKRAIIMAAGIGKRMQPITFEIPKPLIKVQGVRMIDTIISGLHKNGINEIYVVVGHLKEQFRTLEGVTLIENPYYSTCNNISSLYVARDYLSDVMILDGDQIIYDASVLTAEFSRSGYNVVWTGEEAEEWILQVEDGVVKSCSRSGGKSGWQLYSISRWSAEDGEKLKQHLEIEFEEKQNKQIYWDDIALFCYPDEYELGIRKMKKGDVLEIDNLQELIGLDDNYRKYAGDVL